MTIDFNEKIVDLLNDKPVKNDLGEDMTLKNVCVNALWGLYNDEKIDGEEKMTRYDIALKIIKNNPVELTVEEVAKIKELIGKAYSTLVVGQVYAMLEGAK